MKSLYSVTVVRASLLLLLFIDQGVAFAENFPSEQSALGPSVYVIPIHAKRDYGVEHRTVELCDGSMEQSCSVFEDHQASSET